MTIEEMEQNEEASEIYFKPNHVSYVKLLWNKILLKNKNNQPLNLFTNLESFLARFLVYSVEKYSIFNVCFFSPQDFMDINK